MNRPLLILLEGANDMEFLLRLTGRLRCTLPHLPDLGRWRTEGRIVVVPVGGGDPASWPDRFSALGLPEFHLYDREQLPETAVRRRVIEQINSRPTCRGNLTGKRALENYLHPEAIVAAGGERIAFADQDPVPPLVARCRYEQQHATVPWDSLPRHSQRRFTARAKRWLNMVAVEYMTADLLAERDPNGEVLGWLRAIAELTEQCHAAAEPRLTCSPS